MEILGDVHGSAGGTIPGSVASPSSLQAMMQGCGAAFTPRIDRNSAQPRALAWAASAAQDESMLDLMQECSRCTRFSACVQCLCAPAGTQIALCGNIHTLR